MYNLLEWKRTGIGVCLCLFTCISIFAANPDSLLKARIDTLLADKMPRGAEAGICIYDLSKGRTLYEYRADKLSRPSSTMKVMTAITAMHLAESIVLPPPKPTTKSQPFSLQRAAPSITWLFTGLARILS